MRRCACVLAFFRGFWLKQFIVRCYARDRIDREAWWDKGVSRLRDMLKKVPVNIS